MEGLRTDEPEQLLEGSRLSESVFRELQSDICLPVANLLRDCCALDADKRPSFTKVRPESVAHCVLSVEWGFTV